VKVQIYLTTRADADMCVAEGVDFIGLVADEQGRTPSSVSYATAQEIFQAISPPHVKVALTLAQDIAELLHLVEVVTPDILHLAGETTQIPPTTLRELRRAAPHVKLMYAIPMNSDDPVATATRYQQFSDYLLLDTNDPSRVDLGATGKTHDWGLSAALVRHVHVPVILAGGLSPANVSEAIRTVRPWGVDSFSHTNLAHSLRKDPQKVRAFVHNARAFLA
jgi:phosphoribosylanthranilate isomerase